MILEAGKYKYDLPKFDRLEKVMLNDRKLGGPRYELELVLRRELEEAKNKERAIFGQLQGRPTMCAMESQTIYFHPTPAEQHIVDIITWQKVTL